MPSVFERLFVNSDPFMRRAYGSGLAQRQKILRANGIMPVEVVRNTPAVKIVFNGN